jgi:hypothetical protein
MTEGRDASEAGLDVLEAQIASLEPFTESELPHVLHLRDGVGKALNLVRTARS